MKVLLVEPAFPVPRKSKNHKNFLPIGLLKLHAYHRSVQNEVRLVRGNVHLDDFIPDQVWITSLFTYWSEYVWASVKFYKTQYPKAWIVVGGVYASLMSEHCRASGCDEVHVGLFAPAEKMTPDYSPLKDYGEIDYQIIHASRGCPRRCPFCGTWKIEKDFIPKESLEGEICTNKVVFYDNNILANPRIHELLEWLAGIRVEGKVVKCESQSGFDGRLMTLAIAKLLKRARFVNPRIAWDGPMRDMKSIRRQINLLGKAGYKSDEIYVFMVYNWDIAFEEMEKKRKECYRLGVQIVDCRFRPLNQTFDYFNSRKKQGNESYFIHPDWSDEQVKSFRSNVRRQNICVRHKFGFYSRKLEMKSLPKEDFKKLKEMRRDEIRNFVEDAWFPDD